MDHSHLTRKQKEFFDFIVSYKDDHDVWPTYREIAEHFDYRSPNSVTQNIKALIKKGYLVRTEDDEYDLHPGFKQEAEVLANSGGIPVRGIITAGYLQEAVEANLGTINLSMLFPNLDRMFALRVSGRSMIDSGIMNGDFVLLCDEDVDNGSIGAVLYNGETSLKRVYHDRNGLRLEPANEEYSSIKIEPDIFEEVTIIGKYVGHVNKKGIHRAS